MKLSFSNSIFLVVLFTSTILFSQEKEDFKKLDSVIPPSIYSFKATTPSFNSKFSLNSRLNFEQYHFLYLNVQSLENNYHAYPFAYLGEKPSTLIFEAYKKNYYKRQLESSFFNISKLYLPYIPEK